MMSEKKLDKKLIQANAQKLFEESGSSPAESWRRASAITQLDTIDQMSYAASAFSQFDSFVNTLPKKKQKAYRSKYNESVLPGKDGKALDMVKTMSNIAMHLKGRVPNVAEVVLARGALMLGGLDFPFKPSKAGEYTEALGGKNHGNDA